METYIIKTSKKKIVLAIIGALIMIAVGVNLLYICYSGSYGAMTRIARHPQLTIIESYVGLVLFVTAMVLGIYGLFANPIALKIDQEGFKYGTNKFGFPFIPWKDVDAITAMEYDRIGVTLNNNSRVLDNAYLSKLQRFNIKAIGKSKPPFVTFDLNNTNAKVEDVVRIMKKFHEASKLKR